MDIGFNLGLVDQPGLGGGTSPRPPGPSWNSSDSRCWILSCETTVASCPHSRSSCRRIRRSTGCRPRSRIAPRKASALGLALRSHRCARCGSLRRTAPVTWAPSRSAPASEGDFAPLRSPVRGPVRAPSAAAGSRAPSPQASPRGSAPGVRPWHRRHCNSHRGRRLHLRGVGG